MNPMENLLTKRGEIETDTEIISTLSVLLYKCAGLVSGFIIVEKASVMLNKHRDLDYNKQEIMAASKATMAELDHVRTEVNSVDVGTRPDKLKIHDVGPGSVWQEDEP